MRVNLPPAPHSKGHSWTNWLYAVKFHDGTVKIGVTYSPQTRVYGLTSRYRRKVERAHFAPYLVGWRTAAEREVLKRCARIGAVAVEGSELLAGISFGAAATLVTQIARREYSMRGHAA